MNKIAKALSLGGEYMEQGDMIILPEKLEDGLGVEMVFHDAETMKRLTSGERNNRMDRTGWKNEETT